MVPSTLAPPEPELKTKKGIATLVPEASAQKARSATPAPTTPVPVEANFLKTSLMENNRIKSSSRSLDLLIAITVHTLVLSIPILAGLYFHRFPEPEGISEHISGGAPATATAAARACGGRCESSTTAQGV